MFEGRGRVLRNVISLKLCDETVQNQGTSHGTAGLRGDHRLTGGVMEMEGEWVCSRGLQIEKHLQAHELQKAIKHVYLFSG